MKASSASGLWPTRMSWRESGVRVCCAVTGLLLAVREMRVHPTGRTDVLSASAVDSWAGLFVRAAVFSDGPGVAAGLTTRSLTTTMPSDLSASSHFVFFVLCFALTSASSAVDPHFSLCFALSSASPAVEPSFRTCFAPRSAPPAVWHPPHPGPARIDPALAVGQQVCQPGAYTGPQ